MALFDDENKRNLWIAVVAGILLTIGWWLMIDVAATHSRLMAKNKIYFLPGVCGTVAMIIVLMTPYRTAQDTYIYSNNKCPNAVTISILFCALMLSFGSFIWAGYIWIADFLFEQKPVWPGIAIVLQNAFILISNLLLKFARVLKEQY